MHMQTNGLHHRQGEGIDKGTNKPFPFSFSFTAFLLFSDLPAVLAQRLTDLIPVSQ